MTRFSFLTDVRNHHLRFFVALVLAALAYWLMNDRFSTPVVVMACWICFAAILLFFFWMTLLTRHPRDMAMVASEEDSSSFAIFLITLSAAVFSLFAILLLLPSAPGISQSGLNLQILLSIAAVITSWILIHSLFALRYAHLYYSFPNAEDKQQKRHSAGLLFPGESQPDFMDFAYFSFVLGMTFQVSDVQITRRKIRRLALIHSVLAFIYNTAIVAFSINIISGIINK